ncbi:MAG: chorismate lyase [Gammaproteobacteria bacterium]|jgi:chorismate lyase
MHGLQQHHEPVWYFRRELRHGYAPQALSSWLFDPGSLTARLTANCPGLFRVEVQSQVWRSPQHNEIRRLGMRERQMSLIREVYLYCADRPMVFARTVIPRESLSGRQRHLAGLGSRSLGSVLFADPHMHRDEIEVARLRAGEGLYYKAVAILAKAPASIWGRRSVFYLDRKPLLVSEIFLPAVEQLA